MSAAGDKQVRFTFAMDQRSLEIAVGGIRRLTSEVKTLVETVTRAGQGMQGLDGGMLGGISARGGNINASQQATIKGGSVLTSGIAADAKALSASARAGSDAMRQMSSSVKVGLTDQISNIQRLRKELDELNRAYIGMGGGINWGSSSGGGMAFARSNNRRDALDTYNRMAEADLGAIGARNQGSSFVGPGQRIVNKGGVDMVVGGAEGGARGGWMRGLAGHVGFEGGFGGIMRGVMAGGALAGAYDVGVNAYSNRQLFKAEESSMALGDALRKRSVVNQAYGGTGMAVRSNVNTALAAAELSPTELRSALGREKFDALMEKAAQETGNTGTFKDAIKGLSTGTFRFGDSNGVTSAEQRAKLERAIFNIGGETAQAYAQAVQQKQAGQNMKEASFREQFDSEYLGRMQLMRQARLGGSHTFAGNKAQNLGIGTAYTSEELAGARAQLAQQVGGGHMGGAEGLLNLQNGGLGNAAGLMGAAAGYGKTGAFMRSITGASSMYGGKGLVDVSAASQVGDLYTGAMMSGDFNTSGAAGMAGMMSTSALFGGDLRSARGAASGYSALASYSGGQTDRLQQGINVLASVQQGGTLYSQEALRNMSPAQRMDIMRDINSGKIKDNSQLPPELQAQGVTVDMLKGYGSTRDKFMFSEYMGAQGTNTTNKAVDAWKQSGTASLKGLKGDALRTAVTNLGVAAFEAKRAPSVEAGKNMIAQLAAEDPSIFKELKAGGIGDVAANSVENEHKLRRDISGVDKNAYLNTPDAKEALRKSSDASAQALADKLVTLGTDIGASNTTIKKALGELSDAIATAARDIKQGKVYRPTTAPADKANK